MKQTYDSTQADTRTQSTQPIRKGQERTARRRSTTSLQAGGVLLSLAGVLACNYLGLGLGRVVCHGLLVASLGAPMHKCVPAARSRA